MFHNFLFHVVFLALSRDHSWGWVCLISFILRHLSHSRVKFAKFKYTLAWLLIFCSSGASFASRLACLLIRISKQLVVVFFVCFSQREHVLNAHQTTRCRHGGKKTNSRNQLARTLRKIKVFVVAPLRVHSQFPQRNLLSDHTQWERYDSVFTSSHLHGDVIQWRAFELLSQQKKSENSTEFPFVVRVSAREEMDCLNGQ